MDTHLRGDNFDFHGLSVEQSPIEVFFSFKGVLAIFELDFGEFPALVHFHANTPHFTNRRKQLLEIGGVRRWGEFGYECFELMEKFA